MDDVQATYTKRLYWKTNYCIDETPVIIILNSLADSARGFGLTDTQHLQEQKYIYRSRQNFLPLYQKIS